MALRLGQFGKTTSYDVTDTASNFTVGGSPNSHHAFIVSSDKAVHLTRTASSEPENDATVTGGLRITAESPAVIIDTVAGDVVSFILGTSETDGKIWFTETNY